MARKGLFVTLHSFSLASPRNLSTIASCSIVILLTGLSLEILTSRETRWICLISDSLSEVQYAIATRYRQEWPEAAAHVFEFHKDCGYRSLIPQKTRLPAQFFFLEPHVVTLRLIV